MKRKVSSRKLKRLCIYCNCNFKKGDVYYKKREVGFEFDSMFSFEYLVCAKCKYKKEQRMSRFHNFTDKCHHPITEEVFSYIPGESVMQPDHTECKICGKWV